MSINYYIFEEAGGAPLIPKEHQRHNPGHVDQPWVVNPNLYSGDY